MMLGYYKRQLNFDEVVEESVEGHFLAGAQEYLALGL